MPDGKIIKGVGGLYTVFADDGNLYECRAKGIFRKRGIKPLIGDDVTIGIIDRDDLEGNITDVKPRRNKLIRPELANIDSALIVCAFKSPDPNFVTLDKLILSFKQQSVPVILCFNKKDLADETLISDVLDIYKNSGTTTAVTSVCDNEGIDGLKALLKGRLTGIAGVSGVGKSSLINALKSGMNLKTGGISEKLKRGRHTTRHSEIFPIDDNTFIVDTPGFSSLDIIDMRADDLAGYYDEFLKYDGCRFQPCSHTHEPGCAVKEAVGEGFINEKRYCNYVRIYEELRKKTQY